MRPVVSSLGALVRLLSSSLFAPSNADALSHPSFPFHSTRECPDYPSNCFCFLILLYARVRVLLGRVRIKLPGAVVDGGTISNRNGIWARRSFSETKRAWRGMPERSHINQTKNKKTGKGV